MKQLDLFNTKPHSPESSDAAPATRAYWKLHIDGASRNNPGPAGAGIHLANDDRVVERQGYYLGTKTNNQAEYLALIIGLWYVRNHVQSQDRLLIISDSLLLIRQLEGRYKVRHENMKKLYHVAQSLLQGIRYDLMHVLREDNTSADALANKGIDQKIAVPEAIIQELVQHGVTL